MINPKKAYCVACKEMKYFVGLRIEFAKNNNRLLKGDCEKCNRTSLLPICDWENLMQDGSHILDNYIKKTPTKPRSN